MCCAVRKLEFEVWTLVVTAFEYKAISVIDTVKDVVCMCAAEIVFYPFILTLVTISMGQCE